MKLKPCPFCGDANSLELLSDAEVFECSECSSGESYVVICNYLETGCGANCGYRDTKEEAIKAWNTRKGND